MIKRREKSFFFPSKATFRQVRVMPSEELTEQHLVELSITVFTVYNCIVPGLKNGWAKFDVIEVAERCGVWRGEEGEKL